MFCQILKFVAGYLVFEICGRKMLEYFFPALTVYELHVSKIFEPITNPDTKVPTFVAWPPVTLFLEEEIAYAGDFQSSADVGIWVEDTVTLE